MAKKGKRMLLSRENYINLVASIKCDLEECLRYKTDCTGLGTGIHICLSQEYCELIGEKILTLAEGNVKLVDRDSDVFGPLLCRINKKNVSYENCQYLYDSTIKENIIVDDSILSDINLRYYEFFIRFCALIEYDMLGESYDNKKILLEYFMCFFTSKGKVKFRDKLSLKKLNQKIKQIDIELKKNENSSSKLILEEVNKLITRELSQKKVEKEQVYSRFLNIMSDALLSYTDDACDPEASEIFFGLFVEDK